MRKIYEFLISTSKKLTGILIGIVPIVLVVSATDEKSHSNILTISIAKTAAIILTTSVILGTLIGIAGHFIV